MQPTSAVVFLTKLVSILRPPMFLGFDNCMIGAIILAKGELGKWMLKRTNTKRYRLEIELK